MLTAEGLLGLCNQMHREDIQIIVHLATNPEMNDFKEVLIISFTLSALLPDFNTAGILRSVLFRNQPRILQVNNKL